MTAEQFERLPPLLREIVEHDRKVREMRADPVTSFETGCALLARQRELRGKAAKRWGVRIGGGDAATA